jgi:hypothetical protein
MPRRGKTLILFCAIFAFIGSASAVLVDWSALNWPAGSLSNSYNVDPSNPGSDVTVTVSGDTAQLQSEPPQTPAITTNLEGGLGAPASTLTILLDLSNKSQAVTVTVNFSALYVAGANYVSLQLFDVDFASAGGSKFQDEIRSITALSIDGVTQIAPTITISPNNTLTGTGLNQVVDGITTTSDTGASSGDANVTISFGSAVIKSFTFTYGSGADVAGNDPTLEHIGLYNIDYSVVPERSSLGACLVVVGLAVLRSHRWSKSRR